MLMNRVVFFCLLLLLIGTAAHAKILFGSARDVGPGLLGGIPGIYMMDDDGSNLTLLTESEALKPGAPRWSPDGQQIVFQQRAFKGGYYSVYLMDADGTNIQQLIKVEGHDDTILGVSFSPDGKSIIYSRDLFRNGKFKKHTITVMDLATRATKIISEEEAVNCVWSPDGRLIVFDKASSVGGGGNTIWMMGADGQNPRPLIPEPPPNGKFRTHRLKPRWSPDGKQVAFLQREYSWQRWPGQDGTFLIYHAHRYIICDRDGGNIRKLRIPKDYEGSSLDWMGGDSIVFTAIAGAPIDVPILNRDFVWPPSHVYKYHIKTGEITQLTNDHLGWNQIIDWISDDVLPVSPQGKKKVRWGAIKE